MTLGGNWPRYPASNQDKKCSSSSLRRTINPKGSYVKMHEAEFGCSQRSQPEGITFHDQIADAFFTLQSDYLAVAQWLVTS